MVKDRITAIILTFIILYFCIRTVTFLYGVVLVVSSPLPTTSKDTTYKNYPELDRRNLKSQLKYYENNQVKADSTRSK
jgi:hypothetical protein